MSINHAQSLKNRLALLKSAVVEDGSGAPAVSIARKRVDCYTDAYGGTRCEG